MWRWQMSSLKNPCALEDLNCLRQSSWLSQAAKLFGGFPYLIHPWIQLGSTLGATQPTIPKSAKLLNATRENHMSSNWSWPRTSSSQGMIPPPAKAARKGWDKQQWGSKQGNVKDHDSGCQCEMGVSPELKWGLRQIYGLVKDISVSERKTSHMTGRPHLLWWLLFPHHHEFTSPGFKFIHTTFI